MYNNKKIKKLSYLIGGLTALSTGMFVYSNFLESKIKNSETATIYVANQDINALSSVNAGDFDTVTIPKSGLLPDYVTNINQVQGLELKGGLLKGEPLSLNRVNSSHNDLGLNMLLKVVPNYTPSDIKVGDNVRVYALYTDKASGQSDMIDLFGVKKVVSANGSDKSNDAIDKKINDINTSSNEGNKGYLVKCNSEEFKKYYKYQQYSKIIISKDIELNPSSSENNNHHNDVSQVEKKKTELENRDRDREIEHEKENNDIPLIRYTVAQDDTIDSICSKFKTTPEKLQKLNNNKLDIKVGNSIIVPANK